MAAARAHRSVPRRSGQAVRTHTGFVPAVLALLVAALALDALVAAHPAPLPGDVGLILAWQHLILPHPWPRSLLLADGTYNWPRPAAVMAAAIVAVFALLRRWLDIIVSLATMAASTLTNAGTSLLVRRPRPEGYGIVVHERIATVFSYPSGHVEHAVAFLGIVLFLACRWPRPSPWAVVLLWLVRAVLLLMIVAMPFSRALAGEHWPSDILGGLLYGSFWLLIGIRAYDRAAQRWPTLVPANERGPVPTSAAGDRDA
jgi:membrane-associated phospholipid phosphatase